MNATRPVKGNTSQQTNALIEHIMAEETDVRLFATQREGLGEFDPLTDGPETNLPTVAALVYDGSRWIVYDGLYLTAIGDPRRMEVRDLLDAAVSEGSVLFGPTPVEFTTKMDVSDAAKYLSSQHTESLSEDSRIKYARLLSWFEPDSI